VVLRASGRLADQSQPGENPRGEQLRELPPIEIFGLRSAPGLASLVREPDCLCGIRYWATAKVNAADCIGIVPEIRQTFRKVGCDDER
jgi:hypothetical protein